MEHDVSALVREVRAGDRGSFRHFFDLMQPDLFRFVFRLTRDPRLAEDITQESFVRFWEARARLDPDRSPASYLFRIARNLVLDEVSRRSVIVPMGGTEDDVLVRYARDPEEEYIRRLAADEVLVALSYVPERSRTAFILSRYHDMPYGEIAETMQISLQTVKNQVSKALAILRKRLADDESA